MNIILDNKLFHGVHIHLDSDAHSIEQFQPARQVEGVIGLNGEIFQVDIRPDGETGLTGFNQHTAVGGYEFSDICVHTGGETEFFGGLSVEIEGHVEVKSNSEGAHGFIGETDAGVCRKRIGIVDKLGSEILHSGTDSPVHVPAGISFQEVESSHDSNITHET